MNEFSGWTKREEQAAEPAGTIRLASPSRTCARFSYVRGGRGRVTIALRRPHWASLSRAPRRLDYQGEPDPEPAQLTPEKRVNALVPGAGGAGETPSARTALPEEGGPHAERPEHVFSSWAAYQFYSAASSVRLRLLLSVLAICGVKFCAAAGAVILCDRGFQRLFSCFPRSALGFYARALLSCGNICLSGVMQALRAPVRSDQYAVILK